MMPLRTSHKGNVLVKHGMYSNQSFMYGIPVKTASREQMNIAYSMMMYMMGTMARVTHDAVKQFHDDIANYPKLYRLSNKKNVRDADGCCRDLIRALLKLAEIDMLQDSWLHITETIKQSVAVDGMKLYFTIDNAVNKARCEPHTVISRFLVAFNYAAMLQKVADGFGKFLHDEIGIGDSGELSQSLTGPIHGIYLHLKNIGDVLINEGVSKKIDFKSQPVRDGLNIVQGKLLDWENISKACQAEARAYGVAMADEDIARDQANSRTPWNDVQDRIVILGYGKVPDTDLAKQLGRSEAAVRSRARKLGIKKKKKS